MANYTVWPYQYGANRTRKVLLSVIQDDLDLAENGPNVDEPTQVYIRLTIEGAAKPVECYMTIEKRLWDDKSLVLHPLIPTMTESAKAIVAFLGEKE